MSLDAQVSGMETQDEGWGHLYEYDFRTRKVGCSCGWRQPVKRRQIAYLVFMKHEREARESLEWAEADLDENGCWEANA